MHLRVAVSVSMFVCRNAPLFVCNCFLISHALFALTVHSASSAAASSVTSSTNNANFIDIIVLEYATGIRGGYSLPYKVRREYLENALRAGVTYELW